MSAPSPPQCLAPWTLWRWPDTMGRSQSSRGSVCRCPLGSILIPRAFTLSWQLTPQSRSQAGQPADKEPHRPATPGSFACMGQPLPHAVHLHRQVEPWGLDLKSSLQAPRVLGNQRGKTTHSVNPRGAEGLSSLILRFTVKPTTKQSASAFDFLAN